MEKASLYSRLFFSFSLVCLAGAIAYFSYALIQAVDELPELLDQVDEAAAFMGPVLQEAESITALIPSIVEEVAQVREQIPAILAEVGALRLELPAILAEVEKTRESIPPILAEVEQVRQAIPPVIAEVANVREQLPSTMDRAERLIAEASSAGKQASEGAVTGFFTGIVKAPFKMVSGASSSVFKTAGSMSQGDIKLLTDSALMRLNNAKVGSVERWGNQKSAVGGEITVVKEYSVAGRLCRVLSFTIVNKGKLQESNESAACLDENNEWVVSEG
jgi:surface antigen